jgi:soluble lytic murein transglycosylase
LFLRFRRSYVQVLFAAALALFFAAGTVTAAAPAAKKEAAVQKAPDKKEAAKKKTAAKAPKPVRRPSSFRAASSKLEVESADALQLSIFTHIGRRARLSDGDAGRYKEIFAAQEAGDFKKANEVIRTLSDHRLMGHVFAQRFLSPGYKATYKELAGWMKLYADHPGARKIYDLAQGRQPKGASPLTPPNPGRGLTGYHDYDTGQLAQPYLAEQSYSQQEEKVIQSIDRNLSESPTVAKRRLETARAKNILKDTKYDALRAKVAESYFFNNKVDEAFSQAAASSDRGGTDLPTAGWIAGLSAWRKGKYEEAARYFERTAMSPRASAWLSSAGAYWAARSHLRSRHPEKVSVWLQRAAEHPRSFYGIIAVKALGMEQTRFNWGMPRLDGSGVETLARVPAGKRALALLDAGRGAAAEQEMRQIDPGDDLRLQEAMMAFAHAAGEPSFEMRLGSGLKDAKGNLYDSALYPDAPWEPEGGYVVDKALVHAFIRQESKFDPDVSNKGSGATGLMQLMPSTAMNVARLAGMSVTEERLGDPSVNIHLGQKYLEKLLQDDSVKNNLFKLAVAYNAGPGKLARWERTVDYQDDPLLFIESIPVAETRLFVERVLTNYWIYRLKYKLDTDSLEMVASGEWPIYKPG